MLEQWYRYNEDIGHCYTWEGAYIGPDGLRIVLNRYPVVKETPKGVWLFSDKRLYGGTWVSRTSRKRYAYPTKELAWESFIIRKRRQASYLRSSLERTEAAIALTREQGDKPPQDDILMFKVPVLGLVND